MEIGAREIEERLRAAGDPERAAGSRAYLKSPDTLEHLGLRVGQVRAEVRGIARGLDAHAELIELARALWRRPVFETRLTAALLLDARVDLVWASDLAHVRRFVREAGTWALVDPLAYDMLGRLLVQHRRWAERIDSWAADESFWVRRAALLSQARPLRAGGSFARFDRYADAMLDEREFFIRKAIGWVLREAGKSRPDHVYEWLLPRAARTSGVTMREAVKYLSAEQRSALLTAGRPAR